MSATVMNPVETGLEVIDLRDDPDFARRQLHPRNAALQLEGLKRLASAFVDRPQSILQELVDAAVALCGADSSGISIERPDASDDEFYEWVATAGAYEGFLYAHLPRNPSACGVCLERGRPQLFRVSKKFFDILGVEAPLVTDGILLPWQVEGTRGTIFIMAHDRDEAFDSEDLKLMELLADFAAMGVRQRSQQKLLVAGERAAGASSMANDLAHEINNPLQSLTNVLYLTAQSAFDQNAKDLAQQAIGDLERLSVLVKRLLERPGPIS